MSSLCCHAIVLCVCFRIALDAIVTLWCLVICWIWRVTLPRCRWGADGNNSRCWVFIDIKALGYLPYVLLAAVVVTQSVAAAVLVVWQVPFSPSSKPKYPRRPSPTSSVVPPNVDPPTDQWSMVSSYPQVVRAMFVVGWRTKEELVAILLPFALSADSIWEPGRMPRSVIVLHDKLSDSRKGGVQHPCCVIHPARVLILFTARAQVATLAG